MLKIKLKKKSNNNFTIIAIDSRKMNSKKMIKLGYFNSITKIKYINLKKTISFLNKGAEMTNSAKKIIHDI
ncbi:hypothetical protein [Candidatus Vidania fulgoroideorum]